MDAVKDEHGIPREPPQSSNGATASSMEPAADGDGDGNDGGDFADGEIVKGRLRQSRRLPYWLWFAIARSLGIKLHPGDRPVLSAALHAATLVSAAGMVFTNAFYSGYDTSSRHTTTDVVDGTVSALMVALYCGVGVYAHRLAYRLFVHPKFLDKVRLHSKTVMKLNTAVLVFAVIAAFVVVQNLTLEKFFWGWVDDHHGGGNGTVNATASSKSNVTVEMNPCQKVEIPLEICQGFFVFQVRLAQSSPMSLDANIFSFSSSSPCSSCCGTPSSRSC